MVTDLAIGPLRFLRFNLALLPPDWSFLGFLDKSSPFGGTFLSLVVGFIDLSGFAFSLVCLPELLPFFCCFRDAPDFVGCFPDARVGVGIASVCWTRTGLGTELELPPSSLVDPEATSFLLCQRS